MAFSPFSVTEWLAESIRPPIWTELDIYSWEECGGECVGTSPMDGR